MGRKNGIFIGNEKGGKTAAAMCSLIQTAKAAGIDPRTYLRDVLLRIRNGDRRDDPQHGWKGRWKSAVNDHRADILQRLVGQANAAD